MGEETVKIEISEAEGGKVPGIGGRGGERPRGRPPTVGRQQGGMTSKLTAKISQGMPKFLKAAGAASGILAGIMFLVTAIKRSKIFSTYFNAFFTVFSAFIEVMLMPLIPFLNKALKYFVELYNIFREKGVSGVLKKIFGDIGKLFEMIWPYIEGGLSKAIDWIKEQVTGVSEAIKKDIGEMSLEDWLKTMFAPLGPLLASAKVLASALEWLADKIKAGELWDWIKDKAGAAWDWIGSKAGDAWEWIKSKAGDVWDKIWDWIKNKAGDVWDWIKNKAGNIWDWIKSKAGDTWDWFTDKVKGIIWEDLIKGPAQAVWETVIKGPAQWVWEKILDVGGWFKNLFGNAQFGMPYVPKDMLMYLHKGERVVPANQNNVTMYNTFTATAPTGYLAGRDLGEGFLDKMSTLSFKLGI